MLPLGMTRTPYQKLSVSLPPDLVDFVDAFRRHHGVATRSEVIARAVEALRTADLRRAYRDHAEAWQHDPEREFWDETAVADALDDGESRW